MGNHTTLKPIRSHYLHHQFQGPNMSHLTNPLATPNQLSSNPSSHLPPEIQVVGREGERWGKGKGKGMIGRRDVEGVLGNGNGRPGDVVEDEESEMGRLLDEKVGA